MDHLRSAESKILKDRYCESEGYRNETHRVLPVRPYVVILIIQGKVWAL
jgi:hypothetical protein